MHSKLRIRPLIGWLLCAAILTGCSRDPNVRKQKYLESGKKYMAKGKYREASIQFYNALRLDSKFAEAHYELAQSDMQLGMVVDAYVELERTVILEPDNLTARLQLGQLMLAARRYTNAQEQANRILAKEPNNPDAHILKSASEAGLKHIDAAITEMTTAVELDPHRASSYVNLATLQAVQSPESSQAEANFKKAVEVDGKSIPALTALAGYYERKKRFSEAEQILHQAAAMAPKDINVRSSLVNLFLLQGDRPSAEAVAKEAKAALSPDPAGVQFLARFYQTIHDDQAALQEYQQISLQYPKERDIQHAYLELLMADGHNEDAGREVEFILKKFPRDEQALIAKGVLLIAQSKFPEARDILQQVLKANARNVVAQSELGNAFKMLGDQGQAASHWNEAARLAPTYLPAQQSLAALAMEKNDLPMLSTIAKNLIENAPNAPDGYLMQAQVDARQGNFHDSELHLQKAISLSPHSVVPVIDLGRLLAAEKRPVEAEKVFSQVLEFVPQELDALSDLVELYMDNKQPEKALTRAQDFVARFPDNAGAHVLLAKVAGRLKNLELAETELTKAVQLSSSKDFYALLAAVQMQRGESSQLRATLESDLQKNPDDADAYWMLGTVFDQQDDSLNAETNYRKALQLRPDFGLAANNLAFLLLQNAGNVDEAISFAEIARRKMPGNSEVADTLGWAYYQKGMSGLAIQMLQDAVKNNPQRASFHYHLGMAYAKNGSREHAKEELEKALQLESDDARKDEIRKGLSDLG